MRSLGRDILSGTIGGLVSGLIIAIIVAQVLEPGLNDQQNRVENVRFLRDISTRNSPSMPFRNLDLKGQDLSGLNFHCRDKGYHGEVCSARADFVGAKLASATMSLMDLEDADFSGADLSHADLSETDLKGANLGTANMAGVKLDGACYDSRTIWPEESLKPQNQQGTGEVCVHDL